MSSYWERRAAQDMQRAQQDALRALEDIEKLHHSALARVRAMHSRITKRFISAYGLTREEAAKLLSQPCGREEYLKLLEEISRLGKNNPKREALMAKAASGAYAYRMSLQEAMEDEIAAVTARLAEQETARLQTHLKDTVQEQSLRAGFRIAKQTGVGIAFGGVNEELARQLIHRPWSGMDFSARIWKNQDALTEALNDVLREGIVTGRSGEKIAQELSERMGVSMSRARTLVRTETTHACGEADLAAYDEAGIERYRFVATLDLKTSKICRKLDGKVFYRKDAKPGVNYKPMHPNCRSTDVAEISEEELAQMQRWARDPVTGKDVHVPANMTYEEWLKLQEETYGEERMQLAQKMTDNRKRDKKQLEEYQRILGKKQLPSTLEKFQQMKYTEPEEWEDVKYYVRNKGERPVWCVKVDRELEKAGINRGRCYPVQAVEIQGWGGHAKNRSAERSVTQERALEYQRNAIGMFKKWPTPNTVCNYYAEEGFIAVRESDGIVQTVYSKADFKSDTEKVMEVLRKHGQ